MMLGRRAQLLNFYWLIDSPRFRRACRTCRGFIQRYLTEAQEAAAAAQQKQSSTTTPDRPPALQPSSPTHRAPPSFLTSLVSRSNIPTPVMRDQLLSLLLASRDTTASFLSWTLYALARHPEVQTKLRNHIAAHVPSTSQQPTPTTTTLSSTLTHLPYLRHILLETLRLYPVVPLNGRTALHPTVLPHGGGPSGTSPLYVARGTKVALNIFCMHRLCGIYGADANAFDPSRWERAHHSSGPEEESKHGEESASTTTTTTTTTSTADFGAAFAPFILGPRVCLGRNLAMSTISYLIVRLLQTYGQIEMAAAAASPPPVADPKHACWPSDETRYAMAEEAETTFALGITMAPRDGVWVRLKKKTTTEETEEEKSQGESYVI